MIRCPPSLLAGGEYENRQSPYQVSRPRRSVLDCAREVLRRELWGLVAVIPGFVGLNLLLVWVSVPPWERGWDYALPTASILVIVILSLAEQVHGAWKAELDRRKLWEGDPNG